MVLTTGEGFGVNGKYDSYIPRNGLELFHAGTSCDAWKSLGCHWISELKEFRFLVWAPNADQVSLVGDFNGWNPERMERLSDGCWCIFSSEAAVGQYYKYLIQAADGAAVFKADPFAAFSQCGSETASIVWNGGTHHWHDRAFLKLRAITPHSKWCVNNGEVYLSEASMAAALAGYYLPLPGGALRIAAAMLCATCHLYRAVLILRQPFLFDFRDCKINLNVT